MAHLLETVGEIPQGTIEVDGVYAKVAANLISGEWLREAVISGQQGIDHLRDGLRIVAGGTGSSAYVTNLDRRGKMDDMHDFLTVHKDNILRDEPRALVFDRMPEDLKGMRERYQLWYKFNTGGLDRVLLEGIGSEGELGESRWDATSLKLISIELGLAAQEQAVQTAWEADGRTGRAQFPIPA